MNKDTPRQMQGAYRYVSSSPALNNEDAQIVGEELEDILRTEKLTTNAILARAQEESNPLHPFFEWDDAKASFKYRQSQAAHLVRSIEVVDMRSRTASTKSFVNVFLEQPANPLERYAGTQETPSVHVKPLLVQERHWIPVEQMQADPITREEIKQQAIKSLHAWCRKYRGLGFTEFEPIYSFIESMLK